MVRYREFDWRAQTPEALKKIIVAQVPIAPKRSNTSMICATHIWSERRN
jgi:hypothetical protein